ncbi:MAG: hypothetical protein KF866_04015 [Phycisphaeraceae bacterium]|nr:hypothetical protein [Phycisphaeraceae bacterium]MCW5753140.1 hypothetical protein [Phycisphaeraceae bacterium]
MANDFDGLVMAAQFGQNKMAEHDLWKAAFNCGAWYFVADQTGDDAAPVVGAMDGKPYLIAFTDEERAERFSADRARKRGGEATPVLHMEVAEAIEYAVSLRDHGVEGMLFNNGGYSFHGLSGQIAEMHNRYGRSGG